jgi:threonyl-tRNA synthetase
MKEQSESIHASFDVKQEDINIRIRNTTAYVMAAAIKELWPLAQFGVGLPTENGFTHDVAMPHNLTALDLVEIENRMKRIKKANTPVEIIEVSIDGAISILEGQGHSYKVELLKYAKEHGTERILREVGNPSAIFQKDGNVETVQLFKIGDFIDLSSGLHLTHTGKIGHFKLNAISGAYWRGKESNSQLQRISGIGFSQKSELDSELERLEQIKLRDHRRLGRDLKLFAFDDEIGKGLPLILPNGATLRDEFQKYATEEENRAGYKRVITPALAKSGLYERSRHLPYYKDDMYPSMEVDGEELYLRPMICPHHHKTFDSGKYSYKDLPIRFAENGQVYRYESSGSLSGLMRTRGFCQNDAHIYCRMDQAEQEFVNVMNLHARYYKKFGIEDFYMRLSLPDFENLAKYVEAPDKWKDAVEVIKGAMNKSGLPYVAVEGEAAFYGPKIDFMIKSSTGTEYAISTCQLDFLATDTFNLRYTDENGEQQPIYVIHRAPLGSLERFTAFLVEHYAGKFPTWLAPTQARIVPISDRHENYCSDVLSRFLEPRVHNAYGSLRVDFDASNNRMQKKVRDAQVTEKIPYIFIVGDKEMETGTVSVRLRSGEVIGNVLVEDVVKHMISEVDERCDFEFGTKVPRSHENLKVQKEPKNEL